MPQFSQRQLDSALNANHGQAIIDNYLEQGGSPDTILDRTTKWHGWSLLAAAVYKNNSLLVRALLQRGASADQTIVNGSWQGWSLVECAAEWNHRKILTLLVQSSRSWSVDTRLTRGTWEGWTISAYAIKTHHYPLAQMAIEKFGLDCHQFERGQWEGRTFLEYILRIRSKNMMDTFLMESNYHRVVELLLTHGADPNQRLRNTEWTLLTWTLTSGYISDRIPQLLVHAGADPEQCIPDGTWKGWSVLAYAVYHNHAPVVRELLAKGANPHQEIINGPWAGTTIYNYATLNEKSIIMRFLTGSLFFGGDRDLIRTYMLQSQQRDEPGLAHEDNLAASVETAKDEVIAQNARTIAELQRQLLLAHAQLAARSPLTHTSSPSPAATSSPVQQGLFAHSAPRAASSTPVPDNRAASSSSAQDTPSPTPATPPVTTSSPGLFTRTPTRQTRAARAVPVPDSPSPAQ